MRNVFLAITLATLTSGCGTPEEVWAFFIDPPTDPTNTSNIAHTFIGAQPYAGTTTNEEWTNTDTTDASPSIQFGQLVKVSGDDDAFLILGDTAIPGKKSGGVWLFQWSDVYQNTDREQHVATGFFEEIFTDQTSTMTITMDISGGTASGSMVGSSETVTRYSETDIWDTVTVGRGSSSIPASQYIEYPDGSTVFNDPQLADCTGDCSLTITNSSSTSSTFRAEKTKYNNEASFAAVEDATDP